MKLSFAVLLAVANKWRGVRMDVFAARKVEELSERLHFLGGWSPWEKRGCTTRGSGAGGSTGVRPRASARLAVGGDPVNVCHS